MRGRIGQAESTPYKERKNYWGVVLDAPDAHELGRFYATLLEWELEASVLSVYIGAGCAEAHPAPVQRGQYADR